MGLFQALVEMSDVSCAQAAVTFYSQRSPLLRGHVVHVQFSNHDQLLPDDASFQVHKSLDRWLVCAQQLSIKTLSDRLI